jgi:hypothetical protein
LWRNEEEYADEVIQNVGNRGFAIHTALYVVGGFATAALPLWFWFRKRWKHRNDIWGLPSDEQQPFHVCLSCLTGMSTYYSFLFRFRDLEFSDHNFCWHKMPTANENLQKWLSFKYLPRVKCEKRTKHNKGL